MPHLDDIVDLSMRGMKRDIEIPQKDLIGLGV